MPQHVIYCGEVKVHFAGVFRLELACLEFDHHKAADSEIVEQQVKPEIGAADFKRILATDERESLPEFQQKLSKMLQKTAFHLAFLRCSGDRQEVEVVGVLQNLLREIRLR